MVTSGSATIDGPLFVSVGAAPAGRLMAATTSATQSPPGERKLWVMCSAFVPAARNGVTSTFLMSQRLPLLIGPLLAEGVVVPWKTLPAAISGLPFKITEASLYDWPSDTCN